MQWWSGGNMCSKANNNGNVRPSSVYGQLGTRQMTKLITLPACLSSRPDCSEHFIQEYSKLITMPAQTRRIMAWAGTIEPQIIYQLVYHVGSLVGEYITDVVTTCHDAVTRDAANCWGFERKHFCKKFSTVQVKLALSARAQSTRADFPFAQITARFSSTQIASLHLKPKRSTLYFT